MEMRVMGRVEIFTDDTSWGVHGRTQRALLSLLILRLRVWTPAPYLVRALWPSDASDRAHTRLHVQIHRLRRQLGGDVLNSSPNGYRLNMPEDSIDVWRFEREAEAVLASVDGARDVLMLRHLDDAVTAWGGEPFAGVDVPDVDVWRSALAELYVGVQVARSDILLDLGNSRAALDVLTPLAADQPANERVQKLRMSALQQSGRREMLPEVFEQTRSALTALDLEPGPDLLTADVLVDREEEIRRALTGGSTERPEAGVGSFETDDDVPPAEEVALRRELAYVLTAKGRHDEALTLLGHLEALHTAHGQEGERAIILRDMVAVMGLTGDLRRALRLIGEASRLDERTTGTDALLQTLRALVLTHMGRIRRAEECLAAIALPTAQNGRLHGREQLWWRTRSQISRRAGRHRESVAEVLEASRIADSAGAGADSGPVRLDVASCLRDAGDERCFDWYRSVIRFAHDSGRFPLAACAHASVAKAHLLWSDAETAAVHARTALDLARRCGSWVFAARAAARLAEAEEVLGRPRLARWYRFDALASYRRVDFPLSREARARLERPRTDHAGAGGTG